MEIQLRERTVQLTLICSSIVLYDQSFPRKYSFPICVCLSQSVPNKPKIRSVVMEVASLEWVKCVAWAQLRVCCIFVACGAAMSNHWHLNLKSAPKGTWILSVLHGLMQSIDTVGVSNFTLINQCKNTNTLADVLFLISILLSLLVVYICILMK